MRDPRRRLFSTEQLPSLRRGGSKSVVLPKPFLDQLGLDQHDEVEISLVNQSIVVTAHRYATDDAVRASTARAIAKRRPVLERLAKR